MDASVGQFALAVETPLAVPTSQCYRPPTWPPPRDWVCIEDRHGNPVSRWGDPVWDLHPWIGKAMTYNFGDGPKRNSRSPENDQANADILRLLVTWRGWMSNGRKLAANTLLNSFAVPIGKIIGLCSRHKICASHLSRYPALIDEVARSIAKSKFELVVAELDRLRDARNILGFELLDQAGIRRLKSAQPSHVPEQTEYIPPRIWTYIVMRLRECLDDYLAHQTKIEECFAFCTDAYENNGIEKVRRSGTTFKHAPFSSPKGRNGSRCGISYKGPFTDTAQRFGIKDVLERWVSGPRGVWKIQILGKYFTLIQAVAVADLLSFTLMRIEEGTAIRDNCLIWHDDEVYGRIPLIRSKTTKTDPDDDALWVTSPSVESAIRVLTSVARMRLRCMREQTNIGDPYLINPAVEYWGNKNRKVNLDLRTSIHTFKELATIYPKLFSAHELTVTDEDLKIARMVCPTLNKDLYRVGHQWHLAWHQLRRTGAVNMFASGEISDSSMQLQMKHLTRLMPLYYGRGNTSLHLNDATRVLLVNAQYEAMGRQLAAVQTDRFVSPYGEEHKEKLLASAGEDIPVNLISNDDAIHYENAARKNHINFRLTVLGGCMKNGPCDGDCISSVGDCAGGDGKSPCFNVLFDRNRAKANQIRLDAVIKQLEITPTDTPRYRHLEQERRGFENYFAYIK